MLQKHSTLKRLIAALACSLCLFAAADGATARAQDDEEERRRAYRLFDEQQFAAALPLLEKLAKAHPEDGGLIARLGFAIFANTQTVADPAVRKRERARARATLVRAKELGVSNDLLEVAIATIPPDGSEGKASKFSENKEADEAMHAGEAAFVKGELDAALAHYERAMRLDPRLYEAPLFAGDMFLKRGEYDKAGEWYARAIALNPDRETGYRYWGNALTRQGKTTEARDKYIEAIIAEPYNSYVWNNGLVRWANQQQVRLAHPKIEIPTSVSPTKDNQTTITIDPKALEKKDDGSAAWIFYGLARAAWTANDSEKFRKEHPGEKAYRHSLREEADALRRVVEAVRQQTKDGKVKQLDPSLAALVKLQDEGLLEAYVLLARPDEGIAHDYPAYRKDNRDKLRRYLTDYVASGRN